MDLESIIKRAVIQDLGLQEPLAIIQLIIENKKAEGTYDSDWMKVEKAVMKLGEKINI